MAANHVLWNLKGSIGQIVLNRPEVHNAISRDMWESIPQALESLKKAGACVITITGQGSSFASGADLTELEQITGFEDAQRNWQAISNCLEFVFSFDLPTIAVVNGACIGGGCLFACACDIRYSADDALFGVPIARLGIVLDDNNIQRLISLVGAAQAKELLFSGATISGARAESLGLVNGLFPKAELPAKADELANMIAANGQASILKSKIAVNRQIKSASSAQDEKLVVESYLSQEFRRRIKSTS